MRALADSTLQLSVGDGVGQHASQDRGFILRADLRALATIASKYHDLANLYGRIASLDHTLTVDLIRLTTTDPERFEAFYESLFTDRSLEEFHTLVTPQLLTFIERIAGVDDSDNSESSDPITLTELVERLFRIGAGWLEWSPEDTWSATPAEILLARDGLIEKLKAIHGGADKEENGNVIDLTKRRLSADDKARLNAMGGVG